MVNKNLVLRIIFLLQLILWHSFTLWPLDPGKAITEYNVKSWNMENGLPGNFVFAILQTQDGYLWLGTQDGLVRFDSINFDLFTKHNTTPLKDNHVSALYEDRNGTLWIGTRSGGLTRYKGGEFTTDSIENHPALYRIRAIEEDRWGNLWIGSFGRGLTSLNNGKFTTYTTNEGLPNNQVRAIYKDGSGGLWVTTTGGIVKLLKPGIFQAPTSQDLLPHGMIKTACLYEKDTGNLWIGTGGGGLFRLKNGVLDKHETGEGLPNQTITYLYRDRLKNIWIGTNGGGLGRMSNGVLSTLPAEVGLTDSFINAIYEDREGSLWVGTVKKGLYQLRDSKFTNYTTREGLAHDYTFCTHVSRAGGLRIGTQGGLSRLKQGTLTTELTTGNGLLDNNVKCLFEDLAGCLWIGTWGGLHRLKDGELTTFTKKDGLSDDKIMCILGDVQGDTWIGTQNGLNRFNNKNSTFTVFAAKDGLSNNNIKFILKDMKENLWIGTDAGLNRLNSGGFTAYNPSTITGNSSFLCAYQDNEGVLWFGTKNGLIRMEEKETFLYTLECGLVENNVDSILEDERGYLWLSGPNGISRIRKKELEDFYKGKIKRIHPDSYNEKDGMKSRWCTGAGCKTQDGRFWFPTLGGVTMIDPNHIDVAAIPPSPIIEKFIVDGVSIKTHAIVTEKNIPVLAPGKKRLEFQYKGISFINPEKIKFKLKLEGYDKNWVPMETARSTIYTGLSPGHYTLMVTACNPGGDWNPKGASFSFYLSPHFYQTVWFYLLAAFFIITAAVSLYRFRVGQLKARERELSALVEVRTRDLKERTDELEKTHYKLRESKEIIEEKNRHIIDSMRYAHKIQQAMLPIKEKMAKELQDYFVIYKPKDIVSGDFYWFDAIADQLFLAVADCTGHGIPGALLSMIGSMMLHEVVIEREILDPALALSHLHQGFRRILKQEREALDIYTDDGMDVGLCRIDSKAGKIIFTGARHSLYYVKNSKFTEIKGNRKSIGGRQKEERRLFTNHEIDVGNEITIYLTSDGFAHQPNSLNQKYGSHRLKKFLQSHAHLGATQQKEFLLKELERHQANEEQRDDITILGIRLRRPKK